MGFVMVFQGDTLVSGWFLFAFRVGLKRVLNFLQPRPPIGISAIDDPGDMGTSG